MAEQLEPVHRRVALKVIKLGMDTRDVIARFEAERQALAMMEHPHIARVLDAGATESGRPYFVMELVKGEPIATYCDKHKLSISERLQLFDQVCQAVQHAHTKGVIHRDLKSSNVLVATQDDQPCAKVIDFGIAKATSGRLTDKTLFTAQFEMIGTPLYMSPEQADGSADIDTRTDIYSLGVLLYELLTGSTPFESATLRSAPMADVQRIIREVEPLRPSARLSGSGVTLTGVASKRGIEPRKLTKLVRGELDWIVMKAIEKERTRRYETANGLAMDVRRYLAGERVLAAPPSQSYRLRKFVRRNKGAVAAGSLIAIALMVGVAGFAWQASIARHQAALAQARADELAKVSAFQGEMLGQINPLRAGKQLTETVQSKFKQDLLRSGVPEAERAAQIAAFDAQWRHVNATDTALAMIDESILHPAIAAIDKQFKGQPIVAATLRQVLADRYRELGLLDQAMLLQASALETRKRLLGPANPDTLDSMDSMASLLKAQGKQPEAEPIAREALRLRRQVTGSDDRKTIISINNLGTIIDEQGKLAEAEPYYREALERGKRVLGPDDLFMYSLMNDMGYLLDDEGKEAEAEAYYRDALVGERRLIGVEDQRTLATTSNLGSLLYKEGKLSEAEPYFREALEQGRRAMGEEHPDTLIGINLMGRLLMDEGKLDEAERYIREGLEKKRRVLGEEHSSTLKSWSSLCKLYQLQGKLPDAETCARDVMQKRIRISGNDSPDTLAAIDALAGIRVEQGTYGEAESLLLPVESATRKQDSGGNGGWLVSYLIDLGNARVGLGKFHDAEKNLLEARSIMQGLNRPLDKRNGKCVTALTALYSAWNKAEPGKGYDTKAAEWKKKLDALGPASSAAPGR